MNGLPSRLRPLPFAHATRLIPTLALVPAVGLAIGCTTSVAKEVAATMSTGGTIITVNDALPTTGAIAVKDGKIIAVGDEAEILKFEGDATRVVDFVILNQNPLTVDPMKIKDIKVVETIKEGKTSYRAR